MIQPIVCNLSAIPADQRPKHDALAHEIFEAVQDRRELANGYGFRLPLNLWLKVAEWATLEQLCCPFIDFRLELLSEGAFWLSLSGGEGVKELLAQEFQVNFPAQ